VKGTKIYAGLTMSSDSGATWTTIANSVSAAVSSTAVIGNDLFIGDSSGKGVFGTSNNGVSWTRDTTGLSAPTIYNMISDGNDLYVGTYGGGVFKSSNQAANWASDNSGIGSFSTISVCFGKSSTDLYWASNGGNVYRKAFAAGIDESGMKLSMPDIYPNPSIGTFVVDLHHSTRQLLQIYDLSGRLVLSQSINGATTIDASNLNEGVYNLCITNPVGGVSNKKLIIVK
ncbi:MAG TPA: T9SS type A sorting domain-containing protein, partial [Nitrosopumilaceae archaeon]|nr:T9SS type A sorting domain-containing protein [Nitrosopumilaceae archaeon]